MTIDALIGEHRLSPHPFEGYWRETAHRPGQRREGLQLLGAADEVSWHFMPAEISYEVMEGGPLSLTISRDGVHAEGHRLMAGGGEARVQAGTLHTLSCLGAAVLYRIRLEPDAALTDRELMPDDWYPKEEGR